MNGHTHTNLLKQLIDNPLAFISLVALGGIVYLYLDMREFMTAQTAAFLEFTVALKEQNIRILNLEQYHLEQIRAALKHPNATTGNTTRLESAQ